uniref:Uncharacterized protein n=1 Tax=Anguilla anguilla TaxID=7936 RepID=A0A0E9UHQ8_ANGAN
MHKMFYCVWSRIVVHKHRLPVYAGFHYNQLQSQKFNKLLIFLVRYFSCLDNYLPSKTTLCQT